MFCSMCGKSGEEQDKFCRHCGHNLHETTDSPNKNEVEEKGTWDILVELLEGESELRKKALEDASDVTWELMKPLSNVAFESFIEDNKEQLNKQSYKALESLQSSLFLSFVSGYLCWIASQMARNKPLGSLKNFTRDDLIESWQKAAFENYSDSVKDLTEGEAEAMSKYREYKFNSLLESCSTIKDLPHELVTAIKDKLLNMLAWGYIFAICESKYRKV